MPSERDPSGTRRLSAVRAIRALGGTVRVLPGGMRTGIVHGPELPPVLAWERQRAGAWGWDAVPDTRDVRPERSDGMDDEPIGPTTMIGECETRIHPDFLAIPTDVRPEPDEPCAGTENHPAGHACDECRPDVWPSEHL